MGGELNPCIDIHQLEGHGKVLVAVSHEGVLSLGGIVNSERTQHRTCKYSKK